MTRNDIFFIALIWTSSFNDPDWDIILLSKEEEMDIFYLDTVDKWDEIYE